MKGHIRARDRRRHENRKGPCRTWQLVVERPAEADGKRRPVFRTFHGTKAEAEAALRRLITEVEGGVLTTGGDVTLASWFESWMTHKTSGTKPVRPATLHSYRQLMTQHVLPVFGGRKLSSITPAQVQDFCDRVAAGGRLSKHGKGDTLSPSSVRAVMQVFSACMKHAVRKQLLMTNPVLLVESPRMVHKQMQTLDADQVRRLREAASGTRLDAPIALAVVLGPRRGETFGLQWDDIDFKGRVIHFRRTLGRRCAVGPTKTASGTRTVPMSDRIAGVFRSHRASQAARRLAAGEHWVERGFVFTNDFGAPVNPDGIATLFRRILRDADLPRIRWHDLRHTAASILVARGVSITVISALLGHLDAAVTLRLYAHALPDGKRAAADMMGELLVDAPVDDEAAG